MRLHPCGHRASAGDPALRDEWTTRDGCGPLEDEGAEFGDEADEFVGEQSSGADFFPVLVERGG
jgi:hypothetical protein